MWNAEVNGATRYGRHERRYQRSALPGHDDRIPAFRGRRRRAIGFDGQLPNCRPRRSSGRTTDGIVGDGTEAQLIILEARCRPARRRHVTRSSRDSTPAHDELAGHSRASPAARRRRRQTPVTCTSQSARTGSGSPAIALATCGDWFATTGATRKRCSRPAWLRIGKPIGHGGAAGSYGTATSMVIPFAEAKQPKLQGLPRHRAIGR